MRAAILVLSFVPFIYYGSKDTAFHFHGRKVSLSEHLLHAVIGLVLLTLFAHALMGHHLVVLCALVLFVVAGSIDEYIFHHDIPAEESDLHAKEHLALVIFIVVSLATDWLAQNHWSLTELLRQLKRAGGGTA
ncbi:MAG TPA: hypothetical protein VLT36_22620 [Candidatus Dormibacteraeota bacterium]|nr:hypothetical protein [Candidatus Dormibacteraeota bacterium]